MRINGVVYRDSDGDGVLDGDDDFPYDWAASHDEDGDGAINFWREGCDEDCRSGSGLVLDQYPLNPAVSLDLDLDGYPDAWNPNCDATCQAEHNFTIDLHPNDYDNDGYTDDVDEDDDNEDVHECDEMDFPCDVDSDSNNLIDIHDLQGLLLVDNDPTGASLRITKIGADDPPEDTSGCRPRIVRGVLGRECDGYELKKDIVMTGSSTWVPIGHLGDKPEEAFQTNFEGNGRTVVGFSAIGDGNFEAGFFGGVRGANIRNLGIVDASITSVGPASIGALAGIAENSEITNCYAVGGPDMVEGSVAAAGGLVGKLHGGEIASSFTVGTVGGESDGTNNTACSVGGLVGSVTDDGMVTASFAAGPVKDDCAPYEFAPDNGTGGLVGFAELGSVVSGSYSIGEVDSLHAKSGGLIGFGNAYVVSSYWATDTSNKSISAGNAIGALVDVLECAQDANESICLPGTLLYDAWDGYPAVGNPPIWDFGAATELPGLCLNGTLWRPNATGELNDPTDCACSADADELVTNQSFESDTSGWNGFGASLSSSTAAAHTGSRSMRITNRGAHWTGAGYDLLGIAQAGEQMSASLWARLENAPNEPVLLTLRYTCQGQSVQYANIATRTATSDAWVKLSGVAQIPDCNLTELIAYVEGPDAGVDLFVDDVSFATTELSCSGGSSGELYGEYLVTTDWGTGYCVDMKLHNPTSQPTTTWSAVVDLKGATMHPDHPWNMNSTGSSGTVTFTPGPSWTLVIPAGGASHSLGFCADRASGDTTSLPELPVVTASF